jgi:hypothetical protein
MDNLPARSFGGKGIRTPGLLIANETLYQLSYTPEISERRLTRLTDFSSSENGIDCLVPRTVFHNTIDAKERLQGTLSGLRCALQF